MSRSVIVQNLVDSNSGLPPEVIEALVEAERISALSKRAEVRPYTNVLSICTHCCMRDPYEYRLRLERTL